MAAQGIWAGPQNDQQDEPVDGQVIKYPRTPPGQVPPGQSPPYIPTGGQPQPGKVTGGPYAQIDSSGQAPAPPQAAPTGGTPQTNAAAPAAGAWGDAGSPTGWLNAQLQAVSSTDDPSYWATQAAKDPKFMAGDPSAMAWWKDAIERGDGSKLVTSGQLQKRGAGSQAPGQGGTSASANVGAGFVPQPYVPQPYQPSGVVGNPTRTQNFQDQLLEALRGRSQQSLNIDPNDPMIKGQVDAYAAREQQAQRRGLAADAERVGPVANIGAERRAGNEQVGQATAGFQAQLMGQEVSARRQEIQAALSGQMGILSQQQQMQLQEEMAQLDRAQQQFQFTAGNAQQESQFGRTLAQNESQFGRNLGQHAYEFDSNDQYRNSPLA